MKLVRLKGDFFYCDFFAGGKLGSEFVAFNCAIERAAHLCPDEV